jgi:hypothetical protein
MRATTAEGQLRLEQQALLASGVLLGVDDANAGWFFLVVQSLCLLSSI